jgi:hypothetical protein
MNSWESFYPQEWQYIQQGAKESAALGKKNGILAGVWGYANGVDYNPILTNSKNVGSPSYKSMLDWSYANGVGFTHFHVWFGTKANGLASYKSLGFEQIVTELQKTYPATTTASSATPASKVVAPTPKATPKAIATVKATATPKAIATVKIAPTVKATPKATAIPQQTKTAPTVKATSTPTLGATTEQASAAISAPDTTENGSILGLSIPATQSYGITSVPLPLILEFPLLAIGMLAGIVGAIYVLMRRG